MRLMIQTVNGYAHVLIKYIMFSIYAVVQAQPSITDLLHIDYSVISASCATESIQLFNVTNRIEDGRSIWYGGCTYDAVDADVTCIAIQYDVIDYESDCKRQSGQFHTSHFVKDCAEPNGEDDYDVYSSNYPICIGISCNQMEVEFLFNATVAADFEAGLLREFSYSQCQLSNTPSTIESSATSHKFIVTDITGLTSLTLVLVIHAL